MDCQSSRQDAEAVTADCIKQQLTSLHLVGLLPSNNSFPKTAHFLSHVTSLNLSRNGLRSVPDAVWQMPSLVSLDLSSNELGTSLTNSISKLSSLRFLNMMNSKLESIPPSLCSLTNLYRLGLKSNSLRKLPEEFGGLKGLVELFLTDNMLTCLPDSICECSQLVKLQASRNRLTSLPEGLATLPNLEMLRVAVNELQELPSSLSKAPKLAWVSLASNPLCPPAPPPTHAIPEIRITELKLAEALGAGASGEVRGVEWNSGRYALKEFLFDDASPDGRAEDEIKVSLLVEHPGLTRVAAIIREKGVALVMDRVDGAPIAEKPNLHSLLRCRWQPGLLLDPRWTVNVAKSTTAALDYLHSHGIAHGDVYAHNMLAAKDGTTVLCDYGASFFYPIEQRALWEPVEVMAYGRFLDSAAERILVDKGDSKAMENAARLQKGLRFLAEVCLQALQAGRPTFAEISKQLTVLEREFL